MHNDSLVLVCFDTVYGQKGEQHLGSFEPNRYNVVKKSSAVLYPSKYSDICSHNQDSGFSYRHLSFHRIYFESNYNRYNNNHDYYTQVSYHSQETIQDCLGCQAKILVPNNRLPQEYYQNSVAVATFRGVYISEKPSSLSSIQRVR